MTKKTLACGVLAVSFIFSNQAFTLAAYNGKAKQQIKNNGSSKKVVVEQKKAYVSEGEVKAVVNKKNGTMITVVSNSKDIKFKEVVFNITKDTKFIKGSINDLKKGCKVKVTYGYAMTKSNPPQASALTVEITKPVKEEFQYQGIVNEVIEKNDIKMVKVASLKDKDTFEEIVFIVTKETKFTKGLIDELKKGCEVKVTYGPVMTMSLPPQTNAQSIEIVKPVKDEFQYEGIVKEVVEDNFGKMITVGKEKDDSIYNQIRFLVTKETKFINGTMEDLKKDCQVKVIYGPVMTRSIPPQTNAFAIEIIK